MEQIFGWIVFALFLAIFILLAMSPLIINKEDAANV